MPHLIVQSNLSSRCSIFAFILLSSNQNIRIQLISLYLTNSEYIIVVIFVGAIFIEYFLLYFSSNIWLDGWIVQI